MTIASNCHLPEAYPGIAKPILKKLLSARVAIVKPGWAAIASLAVFQLVRKDGSSDPNRISLAVHLHRLGVLHAGRFRLPRGRIGPLQEQRQRSVEERGHL